MAHPKRVWIGSNTLAVDTTPAQLSTLWSTMPSGANLIVIQNLDTTNAAYWCIADAQPALANMHIIPAQGVWLLGYNASDVDQRLWFAGAASLDLQVTLDQDHSEKL